MARSHNITTTATDADVIGAYNRRESLSAPAPAGVAVEDTVLLTVAGGGQFWGRVASISPTGENITYRITG